jgi:hypothetical protein
LLEVSPSGIPIREALGPHVHVPSFYTNLPEAGAVIRFVDLGEIRVIEPEGLRVRRAAVQALRSIGNRGLGFWRPLCGSVASSLRFPHLK